MDKTSTQRMFQTRNSLPESCRREMIAMCNQQLADTFDLLSQVKQAHWNIKGSGYFFLHKLFDDLYERLADQADTIAERAAALGGYVTGTARMACAASRIPEIPTSINEDMDYVVALVDRYGMHGATSRAAIDTAELAGDQVTLDMFTQITHDLDKDLWFLESHIQV